MSYNNYFWNRFKQLKEEEKKQKTSALPADDVQDSAPADSEPEDDSDNETESKVVFLAHYVTWNTYWTSLWVVLFILDPSSIFLVREF